MKNTKILCTIGPASNKTKILKKMVDAGMNAVRINTAHGSFSDYTKIIKKVREIADIPIVVDIKGPELRIRTREDVNVYKGSEIVVGFSENNPVRFSADCYKDIKKGDRLLIKDGSIEASVKAAHGEKYSYPLRIRFIK